MECAALSLSARGHAPLVAYADLAEFDVLCHRMHDAYGELIAAAVYARRRHAPRSAAPEPQRSAQESQRAALLLMYIYI